MNLIVYFNESTIVFHDWKRNITIRKQFPRGTWVLFMSYCDYTNYILFTADADINDTPYKGICIIDCNVERIEDIVLSVETICEEPNGYFDKIIIPPTNAKVVLRFNKNNYEITKFYVVDLKKKEILQKGLNQFSWSLLVS